MLISLSYQWELGDTIQSLWHIDHSQLWFSAGGNFTSQRILVHSWRYFCLPAACVVSDGECPTGTEWRETGDVLHPLILKTTPTTQHTSPKMSIALRLRNPDLYLQETYWFVLSLWILIRLNSILICRQDSAIQAFHKSPQGWSFWGLLEPLEIEYIVPISQMRVGKIEVQKDRIVLRGVSCRALESGFDAS